MACLHYWGSPFQVFTHHLARCFVKAGWDVAYISAPITPLHLLKRHRQDLLPRWRLYRNQKRLLRSEGVLPIVPGAFLAPDNRVLLDNAWLTDKWPALTFPDLQDVLDRAGFAAPDVLYFDNFYHAGFRNLVSAAVTCYHMADDYSGFPGYSAAFDCVERSLCHHADLVAYPSHTLRNRAEHLGARNLFFMPNGVDSAAFARKSPPPPLYQNIKNPVAVYVGAMDAWFDQELVAYCAQARPDISFVLLGPAEKIGVGLRSMGNVFTPGLVSREELPGYLCHAQVGLIPFDTSRYRKLLDPVRPLKLFEYCAAGLPVVSTRWAELELMNSPAYLASSPEEFVLGIGRALAPDQDRQYFQAYAGDNDWSIIFARFEMGLRSMLFSTEQRNACAE